MPGLAVVNALVANGAAFGSALAAVYGVGGAALLQIAAGTLVNAGLQALTSGGRGSQPLADQKRDLSFPTNLPAWRYVYGEDRAQGTPLPWPVKDGVAYGVWLLSSRSSTGPFTISLGEREVVLSGDPYDMAGPGAVPTNAPFVDHMTVWIGRGDQTQPPQRYLDEVGYVDGADELYFKPSDAFRGCTVVYVRMVKGEAGQFDERWGTARPDLKVAGRWSQVWDPRDNAQSLRDPATWSYSDNAILVALDVLTQNPFRPFADAYLLMDLLKDAANASDDTIQLASGGSEPRYTATGTVVFEGAEIEDLLAPILTAAAAKVVRQGGRLGFVPGVWRRPIMEVTDSFGGLGLSSAKAPDDLATELTATYSPSERGLDPAEMPRLKVLRAREVGAEPSVRRLDLSWCKSATQAQRIMNIAARRMVLQRSMEAVPDAKALLAAPGAIVTANLPDPFGAGWNGTYEVVDIDPFFNALGEDGGLACKVRLTLQEDGEQVYAHDPNSDEPQIEHPDYDGKRAGVAPPGALAATTGNTVNLDTGGTILPRIYLSGDPSPDADVVAYEWQSREVGQAYGASQSVDKDARDGQGDVFFYLEGAAGTLYDARWRTVSQKGTSLWVEITGVSPVVNIDLDPPAAEGAPAAGPGQISASWRGPDTPELRSIEIWAGDTEDSSAAVLLRTVSATANEIVAFTETGLSTGQTRVYFGRSRGDFGAASLFSSSQTATAL